jgi:hypothetical protein
VDSLHDGEDDVGLVLDRAESDRGNHDHHKVECPVSGGRQSVGGSTNAERHLNQQD